MSLNKRNSSKRNSSELGIFEVLTIVFIVLKVIGIINWSWLWVLCPLWIDILFTIIVLVITSIMDKRTSNKYWKSGRIK